MIIDCYGFKSNDRRFMKQKGHPTAHITTSGTTYVKFTTEDNCPIWKIFIDANGITNILWTFGAWADRAALTYTTGCDSSITVEG